MSTDNERARFNMIAQQIRPWGVLDESVLETLGAIPREDFVPDAYRGLAYADFEVPIGESRSMLAPKMVGRLLQALALRPEDRILQVGVGAGYTTACLARLGGSVCVLESDPKLAHEARERLAALGVGGVEVRVGDGLAGPVPGAPFDAIAVTGSVPELGMLAVLEGQLAPGGRLFCVVGEAPIMEAWLVIRSAGTDYRRESLFETSVPAMASAPRPETFVF